MEDFKLYTPPPSQFPTPREKTYHVFLSFRGPDVRKTFVDHLYRSLSAAGLHVFLDSERLEKGEDIGMSLQQAIQNSAIHIPIFSTNYASSPWCLKELHLMCKSKFISRDSTLIPLFYKVEPSDVRYARKARGPYYKAFHKHYTQRRYHSDEIREWESALQKVSGLSGWSLKETAFGYEGRLVKRIVLDVLNTLDITCIDLPKHSVGLEDRREEVIKLLRIDDKRDGRVTLGIWGMGGLGKTTLAKALYNHLHRDFEASSFVSQVRATAEESVKGLTSLQTQILKDLTKLNHMELNSSDHGKTIMRNHLTSVRALVILDDVDHVKQLDALLCDCYGEGSLIIITTRDKNVLEVGKVDAVLYQMKGLEQDEAVELFSWHAFMRSNPEEGFEDMTERIVNACGGLPLSLEIIGSHLYPKKNLRYWRDALQKLEFEDVYQTLKISYNALSFEEKQIFLDIACFFIRLKHNIFFGRRAYNMDFYVNFWGALGYRSVCTSLQNIEAKSLMTIQKHAYTQNVDEDEGGIDFEVDEYVSIFSMHDQIREMGRRIVEEESPNDRTNCSRVWRKEDIVSAMALTEEMPSLRGLMCKRKLELDHMDSVASMPKLQFLLWWNLFLKREIKTLPRNLRYVIFGNCRLKAHKIDLKKWPNLELLEVSRTLLEELPGKSKNDCVASPFNFQVRGPTRCKAILFCFVLSSNGENVRVPEMHVEVSGMASEIGMTGWTMPEMRRREIVKKFKLPQCKYSDGSGKSIIRICILKEELRAYVFEEGDNIKCWYKVEEPFPQGGCLVREAQVLLLPEEVGDFDDVIQCLRKWKLLDGPCSPLRERYGFPVVFCHDRRPLVL